MNSIWTQTEQARLKALTGEWIAARPVHNHPAGLNAVVRSLTDEFELAGFDVERIENPDAAHRPLLIARRECAPGKPWIGFFGHYDVETADAVDWRTHPWQLTDLNGRWYGRGIGDNLLPLAQKVCLLRGMFKQVNVVYCLQGEEEIGGPFAHAVFPGLRLPEVALWLEETGYFYRNGRQRLLVLNPDPMLERMLSAMRGILKREGIGWTTHRRTLNKTIGGKQCPCHRHLLKQTPYLAVGPNDDDCAIHGIDESIDPALLALPALQLQAVSEIAAAAGEGAETKGAYKWPAC